MVAVPLETMISTGGHIVLSVVAGLLHLGGFLSRLGGHAMRYTLAAARHVYDIYIVIPLQIEKMTGNGKSAPSGTVALRPEARR